MNLTLTIKEIIQLCEMTGLVLGDHGLDKDDQKVEISIYEDITIYEDCGGQVVHKGKGACFPDCPEAGYFCIGESQDLSLIHPDVDTIKNN